MPLSPFGPLFSGGGAAPNGSSHISSIISDVTGFQAPTSCVAYLVQMDNNNPSTMRVSTAAAASTLTGHQYEPGRSDYIPFAAIGQTLTFCPEGGAGVTCRIQLTWFTST